MDDYLNSSNTKEFIEALIEEETQRRNFATPDFQVIIKGRAKTDSNGNKTPAKVWMHPYLFVKFAMWLNPRFEVKVIKFVYDKLIEYRDEASESYKSLSSAVYRLVSKEEMPKVMGYVAKALNYVIYNNHEAQLRNKQADELLLKDLCELQKDIAKLINFGFINSYDQLRNFLRKRWQDKWNPDCLSA